MGIFIRGGLSYSDKSEYDKRPFFLTIITYHPKRYRAIFKNTLIENK